MPSLNITNVALWDLKPWFFVTLENIIRDDVVVLCPKFSRELQLGL